MPQIVLNFIKTCDLQEIYQNVWISLRNVLTIPVTVATGGTSLFKINIDRNVFENNNDTG